MKFDWNILYVKASEQHQKAKEEASFIMNGLMSPNSAQSVAFFYPEETKNYYKTRRLLAYVEKRMKRNAL